MKSRKQKAESRREKWARRTLSAFCFLLSAFANAQPAQSSFRIFGFLTAREAYVKAPPSWTHGSFGRFDVGADAIGEHAYRSTGVAQLGAEWAPTTWLTAHAQVLARAEPSGTMGKRFGLVEGYAELHGDKWRVRAGEFFLPTSRENTDPLWASPYTITWSALNTWMGQEVRPVGVDVQLSPSFYATVGGTAFRDNDTMGTLPAGRGWALGSRLSVYDEKLGVPPPHEPTIPIGTDLDGKWGFSERIRLQLPERALVQFTHLDNRADLAPSHGQTPWDTTFNHVGAQIGTTGPATVAAEWFDGKTTVGFPGGTFTLDYDTIYLLGSYKVGTNRLSARVERFSTRDDARRDPDLNREHGHAYTVAFFNERTPSSRYGIEVSRVTGKRPGAPGALAGRNTGGLLVSAELRFRF